MIAQQSDEADARQVAELLARLVHEVAKYLSRTARNLPSGPLPAELGRMLVRDLYGARGEPRASQRFEPLSEGLGQLVRDQRLAQCRLLFARIDAMEAEIRQGDEAAMRSAADMAIKIEALLRSMAAEAREPR